MSDTTKLILGIALAILVIALIVWLFASARRRETEARRLEAEAMRAKLAEKIPVVQDREDRASVTARIAEVARQDAEAAAAEAARLEREAAAHQAEAEQLRTEQDELARRADRVDPDVPTDAEGYRVDDTGRRLGGSPVASALGMAALAHDDDEPDLADHENPFPGYSTSASSPDAPDPTTTPQSSAQIPPSGSGAESEHSTNSDSSAQDLPSHPGAESEHSTVAESSAHNLPPGSEGNDPDWVNGPADEEAADELDAQAALDAQEPDWINGPDDGAESEHSTGVVDESSAQDLPLAAGGLRPDGAESGHSTGLADESSGQDVWSEGDAVSAHSTGGVDQSSVQDLPSTADDEGAPFDDTDADTDAEAFPGTRRVSEIAEVVDGGYGVGSAAPIEDGAQPLGHPIMGFHETRTFVVPEAEGYGDTEPDVWFYDEDAARRAGFHAAGED